MTSKIANEPSEVQPDVEHGARVERIPPQQIIPDDENISSHKAEGAGRTPPQEIPGNDVNPSKNQEGVERIPQNCKFSYSEVCLFKETIEIRLINKRKYKVSILFGLRSKQMHSVKCAFGIGTGPKFIGEDFLKAEWLKVMRANNRTALKSATNQKIYIFRTVTLHIRMVDSTVRVVFDVVRNLVVPVLLGT